MDVPRRGDLVWEKVQGKTSSSNDRLDASASGANRLELQILDADELEHSMSVDAADTSRSETSFDARSLQWIDLAPTILHRDECLSCTI